ncbi:MAG: hypothetical protein H0T42_26445 [Deltaproteobacteria bacterium]|nr:hypothetical protein [Deltaproteobacteria bacterium]
MNKLALAVGVAAVLAAGCSKKRVSECDDFVTTAEKLAKCEKLPETARTSVAGSAKQIKDMLQMVDDNGGFDSAPAETVDQMRQACKSQNTRIVEEMQKTFPECLK